MLNLIRQQQRSARLAADIKAFHATPERTVFLRIERNIRRHHDQAAIFWREVLLELMDPRRGELQQSNKLQQREIH